ncbi:MAG: (2Fe-2S)-binding protein [Proteobacteria bacterium]|nr:(2Fe-2S)-binding protein [Pseudomonadota bacterium]
MRIENAVARGRPVTIHVDGTPVGAFAGESIATALLAAGIRRLRESPRAREPRGMFCAMGACQECVVRVDGRAVTACTEPVRDGLSISLVDAGR